MVRKNISKITNAVNKCWCNYCNKPINKNEPLLEIYKQAYMGMTRVNVCALCIEESYKEIPKKALKDIKLKVGIDNL